MNIQSHAIRSGFDGKQCFVHARCCAAPFGLIATAQYLDINGSDLFSGISMSFSRDFGKNWSEFIPQAGLAPVPAEDGTLVGCDATPMYHRKTGKILLLGQTAQYPSGASAPSGKNRRTFYSVYSGAEGTFSQMKYVSIPHCYGSEFGCGNGSGQSLELENGDLLIPVYFKNSEGFFSSAVMKCAFDGSDVSFLEMGNVLTVPIARGLCEPSIVYHKGIYYMTLRNDECGCVAKSEDGLHYTDLQLWKWQDGSLVDTYNTQQHWLTLGDTLYLVYTRRGANNDHVFRHRAPLFMARVENMHLVRDSEQIVAPERGARLGNFGVTQLRDDTALVMAAEWMQPKGCETYGSNNSIFLSVITG